jgi:hypothetical protein
MRPAVFGFARYRRGIFVRTKITKDTKEPRGEAAMTFFRDRSESAARGHARTPGALCDPCVNPAAQAAAPRLGFLASRAAIDCGFYGLLDGFGPNDRRSARIGGVSLRSRAGRSSESRGGLRQPWENEDA